MGQLLILFLPLQGYADVLLADEDRDHPVPVPEDGGHILPDGSVFLCDRLQVADGILMARAWNTAGSHPTRASFPTTSRA